MDYVLRLYPDVQHVDDQIRFFNEGIDSDDEGQGTSKKYTQPHTLYQSACRTAARNFRRLRTQYNLLTTEMMFDVYEAMFTQGRLCQVGYEWSELPVILPLLKLRYRRPAFTTIFQAIIDHGVELIDILVTSFGADCETLCARPGVVCDVTVRVMVQRAFDLGIFLCESGWYPAAEKCFRLCLDVLKCQPIQDKLWVMRRQLDCQYWLLDVCTAYCRYPEATLAMHECHRLMEDIDQATNDDTRINRALIYSQCNVLHLHKGAYEQAMRWAVKAVHALDENSSIKTIIDVLRHASRAFVVRRKFAAAGLVVRHAVKLARYHFDDAQRLPAPLLDLAFFLMNIDLTTAAATVYDIALGHRLQQFGHFNNLKVAQANEDLAYALYIKEYSTGEFSAAREHAERAIEILKKILPEDHLLLASCSRVKALVLEEIAIDLQDKKCRQRLLGESEQLHLHCLRLFTHVLGEHNLQTAKHYANLGRLYQSDERYEKAEEMHRRAIAIKEKLLGADDYEVALSLGHLASLYNYDLGRYDEAEQLYLRSIDIGRKLFDGAYSSLEYDYRGLVHIYSSTENHEKLAEYLAKLSEWHTLRETVVDANTKENLWEDLGTKPEDTRVVLQQLRDLLKTE